MNQYIQTIILISAAIVLGNLILFTIINVKNSFKNDLEKYTFYFWLSVAPIFLIGMNITNPKFIPFVTILSMFTVKSLRNFWCTSNYKKSRERIVLLASTLLFGVSLYLFKTSSHPFLYAIPISVGLNLYLLEVIFCAVSKKEKKAKSVYEKIFLIPLFIGVYNNISPILGQTNVIFDLVGWSTALMLYQFISILMPLIILDHAKNKEKLNLELEVASKTKELVLEKIEISQKHKEAIILSKENQALFNTLSHDIATPILAIDLLLNRVLKISENEKVKGYVSSASGHIQTVIGLIKSTKLQRQLNAKKDTTNLSLVDVADSINKCIEINQVFIDKKQVNMVFDNELSNKDYIKADASIFILSIVGNLISNAIKFSPFGGLIYIEAFKEIDQIVVEVQDSGPGIDFSKIEKLKEHGFTDSEIGSEGEEGSGFGLASTFKYISKYKGDISFHKNDTGTLARISFPATYELGEFNEISDMRNTELSTEL